MSYIMEDEINSQGSILENLVKKYIVNYCVLMDVPLKFRDIVVVASGSSYNAGVFGKYFFENIAKIKTTVDYASEFANNNFNEYDKDTLYVFISQSGESSDTCEAITRVKKSGAKTLAIVNNDDSFLYNNADYKFNLEAGKENAIAATKTFSATVLMLWIIALKFAQNKHIDVAEETKDIYLIKSDIENSMSDIYNLEVASKLLSKQTSFPIFGFGEKYALCLEAALKIKETSYINTSSYPTGDFIHGHFAVLNENNVFLTFVSEDANEFELKTLKKIKSTYPKAKSIIVSDVYEDYDCDILVKFSKGKTKISTLLNMIIAVQLMALKTAIFLKRDVDNPKGLVKVVGE